MSNLDQCWNATNTLQLSSLRQHINALASERTAECEGNYYWLRGYAGGSAHVLGIKPGEAVVIRNIGGRITPGLLEQLGLLGRIGEVAGKIPGGGGEFHLIVLHHTDCGITRVAGDTAMLAKYFQIPEADLNTKAVTNPHAALAVDVASLRAIPALPGEWLVSGLVYDVATGLVEIVVPPTPIRSA